jgi:hypothetical protein
MGANVFGRRQTRRDLLGRFRQVGGSPFDSNRPRQTRRIRMACKRSGVRIPIAPQQVRGPFPGRGGGPFRMLRGSLRGKIVYPAYYSVVAAIMRSRQCGAALVMVGLGAVAAADLCGRELAADELGRAR